MRLFIAVRVPDNVALAAARLLPELPALRPVKPELMHLTLAFLGAVADERAPDVVAAAESAASQHAPFDLALDRPGRFPERGRPHTIWLGASAGAEEVLALGAGVRAQLGARALPYDQKPMRAHVTLGRVREGADGVESREIATAVRALEVTPLSFRVDALVVFESVLSPKGPRYTARATASLRRGGNG